MLLDTQITMPSQDPMAEQEFSLASRKIRKWLNALPYINQNIAATQFYDGLRRSNRQTHITKQRLIAIEIMRPVAREFLKEQKKYLVQQPFPLSKKATEVLKLQQNILGELAIAYKIIIQETINRDIQLNSKKLIGCIHHAMFYMLEQYITLSQVYSEPPKGYWQDYCQLYKMAEQLELNSIPVKTENNSNTDKSSVNCLFKQACLLSLANLHSFGHGEAEKIAAYLNSKSQLISLSDIKSPNEDDNIYFVNLALNKQPRLVHCEDLPISSQNRYLDASKLINELCNFSSNKNENLNLLSNTHLHESLAKRLLNKIAYISERSEKRTASSHSKLSVVIGLREAINILVKPISDTENSSTGSHPRNDEYTNAWNWVGHGNPINESNLTTSLGLNKQSEINIDPIVQAWEISNESNGGYCIRSDNSSDYQAQVGDLVLLRLNDNPNDGWQVGIVRWMQSSDEKGVKIGIETLKGKIMPIKVVDSHFAVNKYKGLEHILQLCQNTTSDTEITFIAPPNSIEMGESLDIFLDGKNETIYFQKAIERTISFVRFTASTPDKSSS